MIYGLLDPYVLACPIDLTDEGSVINYVKSLIAWRDYKAAGFAVILLPRTASEVLADTNGFPPWRAIGDVLSRRDLGIQPADVFELLNALLNKGATVEDVTGVNEVLLENSHRDPDYADQRPIKFREEFDRMIALISVSTDTGRMAVGVRQLLTSDAPCPHMLQFSSTVNDVEYAQPSPADPLPPLQVSAEIVGVCCPRVAVAQIDSVALWEIARNDQELAQAIHVYVQQHAMTEKVTVGQWRIGRHFTASIAKLHLYNRAAGAKILRACSETILMQRLEDVHAIREDKSGGSAQIMRSGDGAFRRDVDYELHLHFWLTTHGPELASIVTHNEMSIPD
jgi:hypothetical protein